MSEKRGLGRKIQLWVSALQAGDPMFWKSRAARPEVVCPFCETRVGVYKDQIVYHSLGNHRPDWMEVASEIGPVARWCPGSDQPAGQLVDKSA